MSDADESAPVVIVKPVHEGQPGEGFEVGWETHGSVRAQHRGWYGTTPETAIARALNSLLEDRAAMARRDADETDVAGALFAEWCKRTGVTDWGLGPTTVYELEQEFPSEVATRTRVEEEAEIGRLLTDAFDRCQHGRHEGDVCSECGGPSKGWTAAGAVLGYTMAGVAVRFPARDARWRSVDSWLSDAVPVSRPGSQRKDHRRR